MDLGLHAWLQQAPFVIVTIASTAFFAALYAAFIPLGFAIELPGAQRFEDRANELRALADAGG